MLGMEQEFGFDELKQKPFKQIQVDGGGPVSFFAWRGVSPYASTATPGAISMVRVRYFLNGNRLRVRRDVSYEEVWYTLS
jgi:hypothetical protein